MTDIRTDADAILAETVREAASAACAVLDQTFPGGDSREQPGITSNFAGLLEAAIMEMLKGRSILDATRGHSTALPTLVIDESFFGRPSVADAYLVVMYGRDPEGVFGPDDHHLLALCPDMDGPRRLDGIEDAFTSADAAAAHASNWLQREGVSLERARQMQLVCKPVGFAENTGGYFVLDPAGRRRAA